MTLLSPNRPDAILALMEEDGCVSMASTVAPGDHVIHVVSLDGRRPPNRLLLITTSSPHRSLLSPGTKDATLRVSSSMRTHLAVCFSSLDVLDRTGADAEHLFLIRQSCLRMLRDIANLTALSSHVSGHKPHLLYGSLSAYARGLLGAAAKLLRENGFVVHLQFPQEPILTRFDSKELSLALLNILTNAGKFGAHTIRTTGMGLDRPSQMKFSSLTIIMSTDPKAGLVLA